REICVNQVAETLESELKKYLEERAPSRVQGEKNHIGRLSASASASASASSSASSAKSFVSLFLNDEQA
ncbi:hypothetical protein TRV_03435, partial [Trichophyton verrucosum HKI 0517]